MRCVPKSCVEDLEISTTDIIQSDGIDAPYGIYLVSRGRNFKGITLLPGQEMPTLKSHEIKDECMNVELPLQTYKRDFMIMLKYENVEETTKSMPLTNNIGEILKNKFDEFLINNPKFKLNNARNVPVSKNDKLLHKRFILNNIVNTNNIVINLNLGLHSDSYEEIPNETIYNIFIREYLNKNKLMVNSK